MKQKAKTKTNKILQKNVRQNSSKTCQSPSQERKGILLTLKDGRSNETESNVRKKAVQSRRRGSSEMEHHTEEENKKTGHAELHAQHKNDNDFTGGKKKMTKHSPKVFPAIQERINNDFHAKPEKDRVVESEESESNAGSSVEASVKEISNNEEAEEQSSDEEPVKMQASEESSERSGVLNSQRDTEQSAKKQSDKEKAESTRSDSKDQEEKEGRKEQEQKRVEEKEEEEQKQQEEDEQRGYLCEIINHDKFEDKKITWEERSKKPTADKASRQHKNAPAKPVQGMKYKMFKKTKDQQAAKTEKQRAKAEKLRLKKEAKQKAKEEKEKKKKPQKEYKSRSTTEGVQPPMGISLTRTDPAKSETQLTNKVKNIKGRDSSVEVDVIMLPKGRSEELKTILDPEEQQGAKSVINRKSQILLLGKVKTLSLQRKATNKILAKPDKEETDTCTIDGGFNNFKDHLMAREKSMKSLCRLSGWIQNKMPQGLNWRKKLSAWTKAIGISRWLSVQAINQKHGLRKSKGNIFKKQMAVGVESKANLANRKNKSSTEDRIVEERATFQGTDEEGTEETVQGGEKVVEARYAVVLPTMNKLSKENITEAPKADLQTSTPAILAAEATLPELRPTNPGVKSVLPIKPDLNVVKCINKPLSGGLTSVQHVPKSSSGLSESTTEDRNNKGNQDRVNMFEVARGKVNTSEINIPKMSLSVGGPTQASGQEEQRGTSRPFPNGESSAERSGVRSLWEEEADKEVAHLMSEGRICSISKPKVHWTGNPRMSRKPQVWVIFLLVDF